MTINYSTQLNQPEQLRREVVDIITRRKRGLPGYRGDSAPAPASSPLEKAKETLDIGHSFLKKEQFAEALLRADLVIGMAPRESRLLEDGWTLRGNVSLRQGNVQSARHAFQQAMLLNPAHIPARMGMTETFRKAKQPNRAIPIYLETIPLVQNVEERTRLRCLLADCYLAAGKPEAARRVLRTVESTKGLSAGEKMRAAFTMLLPDSILMWLLLFLLAGVVASFAVDANLVAGFVTLVIGFMLYAGLQWWRTPVH